MNKWKVLGLAGIVGVALVGVAAGTTAVQRSRREYADAEPDELVGKLQERLDQAKARQAG